MSGWPRDLIIAIIGAVLGAMIVYFFSAGLSWSAKARVSAAQRRKKDLADWSSGDFVKRQRVINAYLFAVLKSFIAGNILIATGYVVSYLEPNLLGGPIGYDYVEAAITALGVCFFIVTLAQILSFTKLIRS